jgi:hypothetical protein
MTHAPTATTSNIAPATPSTGVAAQAAPAQAAPALVKGGTRKVGGKGTCKGGAKKVGGKKSRKMPGAAKSWVKFVMEVFNKNRAKNPKYKYKQAMKDAAKLKKNKSVKVGGADEGVSEEKKPEETA